jgi:hypothetical protein
MFSTAHLTRTVTVAATVASLATAGPALARPSEPPLSAAPHLTNTPGPGGREHGTPPRVEGMGVIPDRVAYKPAGPVVPLTRASDTSARVWLIAGILAAAALAVALIGATARHRHTARRLRPRRL